MSAATTGAGATAPASPDGTLRNLGRVHLIGAGGAGMSGIARILRARGVPVSGSDAKDSEALQALRVIGVDARVGHDAANLADADTVVVSAAVRESNPELAEARRRGLPVLHRAAALAALMAGRRGIAVAGTHGKTTTTSMLTVALQHCGADPSFAIGGDLMTPPSDAPGAAGFPAHNAHHGAGQFFVAEADESDGSFLLLEPDAAVVTNIEADHLDHHGTVAAYERAFRDFADRVATGGFLVACADDPGARRLADEVRSAGRQAFTYGTGDGADLVLADLASRGSGIGYLAVVDGRPVGEVRLAAPGRHVALNSAAALLTGLRLGLPGNRLRAGLAAFGGVRRRFEFKGEAGGVRIYDDYAHHPTELAATLRAAREVAGVGRLIAVFQPHLYSRTRTFAAEFGTALGLADEAVVMDVYAAREDPEPGVTGELVAAAVPLAADRVRFEADRAAVVSRVAERARPGDLVITLGAGDVTMLGPQLLAVLGRGRGAR